MKAMIWGVSGQDGSYLSEFLLAKGYEVIGVKRRSSAGSLWRLESCLKNRQFNLVEGDITDYSSVLNLLDGFKPDEVYNLAAQSNVGISFNQPGYTWDVTAKGVLNILESMKFLRSTARLYQASSSEMFGTSSSNYNWDKSDRLNFRYGSPQVLREDSFQDENTIFVPQSPYAIAKLAAHHSINLYRKAYGIWACGGILFNHESPRRGSGFVTRKITKWVNTWLTKGVDKKLQLGNLDSYRDWGYAKEYVEAMWLMLQQDSPKDYVIGTGETHTVKEFLHEVLKLKYPKYNGGATDWERWLSVIDISDKEMRPAEVPYLRADASLAEKKLGWKPKTKFHELVQLMVENENGLD